MVLLIECLRLLFVFLFSDKNIVKDSTGLLLGRCVRGGQDEFYWLASHYLSWAVSQNRMKVSKEGEIPNSRSGLTALYKG